MDFSLFLIHDSCAMVLIYGAQGSQFSKPALETSGELPFTFFHILQHILQTSQTKSQQVYLWRYGITIIISLLVKLLVVISFLSWYFIKKYRLQINFPGDNSRQNRPFPGPNQNTREHSTEVDNQETTFQGKERIFSTTLVAALKRVPSKDEQYGFVPRNNQCLPQVHSIDLTCKALILRRPSAPLLESNPFCVRENNQPFFLRDWNEPFCRNDHLDGDKFATIRRAKEYILFYLNIADKEM